MKKVITIAGVLIAGLIVVAFIHNFQTSRLTPERLAQIRQEQQEEMQEKAAEMAEELSGMTMDELAAKYDQRTVARITTTRGVIVLELYGDETPVTVASFVNLASRGFYDGLTFYRVIPGFMIQGGSPNGKGDGNPGYEFEDEISNNLNFDRPGLLAMANAGFGTRTNGSQFFITHAPCPHLNGQHTIFGRVLEGQPVVDAVQQGDEMLKVEVGGPYQRALEKEADRVAEWNGILDQHQ